MWIQTVVYIESIISHSTQRSVSIKPALQNRHSDGTEITVIAKSDISYILKKRKKNISGLIFCENIFKKSDN